VAKSPLRQAIDAFRQAQREHARDVHDAEHAAALRHARLELDRRTRELLGRLPFQAWFATAEAHLAVKGEVLLREGRRVRGQTLCGAPSGRPPPGRPAPCPACLLVAERYLVEGPPPLELELGI
jgi:hypothetical protein